jgi:hypothetical protein
MEPTNDNSEGAWKTKIRLLKCQTKLCPGSSEAPWKSLTFVPNCQVPFLADITCGTCQDTFSVCVQCAKASSQLRSIDQIKKHCRNCHGDWLSRSNKLVTSRAPKRTFTTSGTVQSPAKRTRSAPLQTNNFEEVAAEANSMPDDATMLDGDNDSITGIDSTDSEEVALPASQEVAVHPILRQSDIGIGCRENNAAYFYKESKAAGGGLDYLVGMAAFEVPDLDPGTLDKDEVSMYANTANFAGHLSKPNRDRLAHLTKEICNVVKKQTLEEVEVLAGKRERRPFLLEPLQTPNDIRMQFFDQEKSLFNLLPHPPLFECEGHTYSLYSDCIRDALGKGFDLEKIAPIADGAADLDGPVGTVPTTRRCKMLFDLQEHVNGVGPLRTVNLYMNEWSDDADPATSIKCHRGSLWFKSVTISPTKTMVHSMSHTYPLALGRKDADHEHVGRLLAEDLRTLASEAGLPMYSVRHGGIVLVRAQIYACLMDQPERRGENHLLGGNSNQHKRFGYSFPWHDFEDVLRPCKNCRALLLDESRAWDSSSHCPHCTNFASDPSHPMFQVPQPEDFPLEIFGDEEMLGPLRLSYHLVANAVRLSHDLLISGLWNEKEAMAYLDWHCIKKKSVMAIILHADHCRDYSSIMDDPLSSAAEKAAATRERDRHPDLHAPWPIPSLWERGVLLEQSPDVPMHLLFLGVVKTTMLRIQQWMSNKRKMKPFVRAMTTQFESLDKLKLSWMKTLPYKAGKFGGWVSENYLSISRLLKWFYSSLDLIASDAAPWQEPNKHPEKWSMLDNKAWLQLHGFPTKDMNAAALTAKVKYYMTEVHPFPPVVAMTAGPVETVMATVASLDEMISLVMVREIPNEEYYSTLDRKIRIFLTHFADMEERLPLKKRLPTWLSCYNFLSLLNLPDVIRDYGPIRNIWEGAAQGEGILRFVKPNVSNGMRRAWENATMKTLMRKKSMGEVADVTVGTHDFVTSKESTAKSYHPYDNSLESLDDSLRLSKEVVSCVQLEDGRWGIVTRRGVGMEVFHSIDHSELEKIKFRLCYFSWRRELGALPEALNPESVVSFGLLLPLLQYGLEEHDDGYETHTYALIDSEHRTLNYLGDLCYA